MVIKEGGEDISLTSARQEMQAITKGKAVVCTLSFIAGVLLVMTSFSNPSYATGIMAALLTGGSVLFLRKNGEGMNRNGLESLYETLVLLMAASSPVLMGLGFFYGTSGGRNPVPAGGWLFSVVGLFLFADIFAEEEMILHFLTKKTERFHPGEQWREIRDEEKSSYHEYVSSIQEASDKYARHLWTTAFAVFKMAGSLLCLGAAKILHLSPEGEAEKTC